MARVTNFLSRDNSLLTTDDNFRVIPVASFTCDWTSTNSASTVTSTDIAVNSRYAIRLAPSSTGEIVIQLNDFTLVLDDNERTLSFNAKIKGVSSFSTSTSLYIDGDDSGITPNDQEHGAGYYSAVHSNIVVVEPDVVTHTATVRISITNHGSGNLLFTNPHLIDDNAFLDNFFVQSSLEYLPDFYWDLDSQQTSPTYPFFKLINSLSSTAGDTQNEFQSITGFESEELRYQDQKIEYWGSSSLVSPNAVKPEYLPWLIQFTGNSLHRNFKFNGNNLYFTNHQLERDFIEWQLRTSFFGRGAGTRRAMIDAVRQILIRTKDGEPSTRSVALTQKFGGDPFAIRIQTLTNETIDADQGDPSALVLKVATLAKPIGYSITHLTVDEFFFTLDDLTLGVIGEQSIE